MTKGGVAAAGAALWEAGVYRLDGLRLQGSLGCDVYRTPVLLPRDCNGCLLLRLL